MNGSRLLRAALATGVLWFAQADASAATDLFAKASGDFPSLASDRSARVWIEPQPR